MNSNLLLILLVWMSGGFVVVWLIAFFQAWQIAQMKKFVLNAMKGIDKSLEIIKGIQDGK